MGTEPIGQTPTTHNVGSENDNNGNAAPSFVISPAADDTPPPQESLPTSDEPPAPIIVVHDARYCHVTGCVFVPVDIDDTRIMTNWVMSSSDNIIAPAASARIGTVAKPDPDATGPTTRTQDGRAATGVSDSLLGTPTPQEIVSSVVEGANETRMGGYVRRAWPTVCRARGSVYRPSSIVIGPARINGRDGAVDTGVPFLRAHNVSVSTLSGAQLAHRVAQAHSSIVSMARPTPHTEPSLLGRLVRDGTIGRPSVLWDMRSETRNVTMALGVAAPMNEPDAALVRLYRPDHPEVIAAGDAVVALARSSALVRVLGIEVAVSPEAPTMRLPLDAPEWAIVDVGVRACYFDSETRRAVVDALCRAGCESWRTSPLWTRGTVLTHEADGVLRVATERAPVLAFVLAGCDPARPVRLCMRRDDYVHTTPPHQVRYQWTHPADRPADHDDGISVEIQYAQVDLASWMNRSPGGTCLIGNCAFQGRAVLVDYEADAVAVFCR